MIDSGWAGAICWSYIAGTVRFIRRKALLIVRHKKHVGTASLQFSKFLEEPVVALSLVVLGLVALVLSVINFAQAVYLY